MTREQLLSRIQGLPVDLRETALAYAIAAYGSDLGRAKAMSREVEKRRRHAGDPLQYIADVLKWNSLTPQQEHVVEVLEKHDRVLIGAANAIGKTFVLACWGLYRFDAVAALPDPEEQLEEQGARLLLLGPSSESIRSTIYAEMLKQAARAERFGSLMPGYRTDRSVNWFVRPQWDIEALHPPKRVGETVAHAAAGRHHRNLMAIIEEIAGVDHRVISVALTLCAAVGNKIVGLFNPTETSGPVYAMAQEPGWHVAYLSALDHPNVRQRRVVVPACVSHEVIDERVKNECQDIGSAEKTVLNAKRNEFLYALPPSGAAEKGRARKDGIAGHPLGRARAYRPRDGTNFEAQVLGRWPSASGLGLFDRVTWEEAIERWKATPEPERPPDNVGLDPATTGQDDPVCVGRWGESAESLLRAYIEARRSGPEAVERLRRARRIRLGMPVVLSKGRAGVVAEAAVAAFPGATWTVDEGGTAVFDHLGEMLGADAQGVSFAATPPDPLPGEPLSENMRTSLYVRFAMLVAAGLCDVPPDRQLMEEVLAYTLKHRYRSVEAEEGRVKRPSVLLLEKDAIKRKIGRSPDRGDAAALSLFEGTIQEAGSISFDVREGIGSLWNA